MLIFRKLKLCEKDWNESYQLIKFLSCESHQSEMFNNIKDCNKKWTAEYICVSGV